MVITRTHGHCNDVAGQNRYTSLSLNKIQTLSAVVVLDSRTELAVDKATENSSWHINNKLTDVIKFQCFLALKSVLLYEVLCNRLV